MEKAIEVVEKRIQHLEIVSKVTGNPYTHWQLEEAKKILALLVNEQTSLLLEKELEENVTPDNS